MKSQHEREEVASLFHELIQLINQYNPQHLLQLPKNTLPTKTPSLSKRKTKIHKPQPQLKDYESAKQSVVDPPQVKSIRKQSQKHDRKQMNGEEVSRKAIFNDYSKVMTYKIHKEEKVQKKQGEEGGQSKQRKKTFSIIKNLAISIPGIKQSI